MVGDLIEVTPKCIMSSLQSHTIVHNVLVDFLESRQSGATQPRSIGSLREGAFCNEWMKISPRLRVGAGGLVSRWI